MKYSKIKTVIASVIILSGCQSTLNTVKENAAEIGGAITGAVVGKQVGGEYKELWMLAGAAAGAYIASEIKDALEDEDKENLASVSVQAAETEEPTSWENEETGVKGEAKVVASGTDVPNQSSLPSNHCRQIEQKITKEDGTTASGNITYCKDADGVWQAV